MTDTFYAGKLPILALRGLTIFPDQTVHFDVGRPKSVRALEAAMKQDQYVLLIPQKDIMVDEPKLEDLYSVGVVAHIKQVLKAQGDNIRVLVTGVSRAKITQITQLDPYMAGIVETIPVQTASDSVRGLALRREAVAAYAAYMELSEHPVQVIQLKIMSSDDCGFIADTIAQNSGMDFRDKCKLLSQMNPVKRLETALKLLRQELAVLQLEAQIQEKTQASMDQNQKDYYLREQMKAIREELGEEGEDSEFESYASRIVSLGLEESCEKKLLKDIDRLKKQPFGSQEAAVLRNYLDTILDLPWSASTKERVDVAAARKILEQDHFGMEKVKERILETIAVRQMAPNMPPQIICLVGPPGVGKTSITYSIAKCLNRKMARISLGGVHDEADIRGHRKTYVGAMPGRIMTALAQAGSKNALILLDEIDKMGQDLRGDPSAALLEVLDGEQNHAYRDHYIEIPFDLSQVMFITTANTLDTIPRPLLDRMEIIELGSYTDEEKVMISKNHLIPKQLKKHGMKRNQVRITEEAIRETICCYTRESGVRNLERCYAEICRKTAMTLLEQQEQKRITVTGSNLETFLGAPKFLPDRLPCTDQVGLVTGLAWTSVGGETLEVEVNAMPGSGKLELTGNLGDVMKESAHAALSYIRANAEKLGVPGDFYKTTDIHVHFPEGAVPKDGPSAGVTVCTAIVSALTGVTVRRDVAMTGEISLRGRVMRIGGLKEKTMAALRHGIRTVIIPADNEKDLNEIDQTVRKQLNFITAQRMETVLAAALNHKTEMTPGILKGLPEDVKTKAPQPGLQQ